MEILVVTNHNLDLKNYLYGVSKATTIYVVNFFVFGRKVL
jgi:hypothetical protein